ncbi:MAG: hypothetical protein IT449_15490 [Phycisphaerales bacterium]|nr:hypothetical protein [Phycisphaerales bacterium]
MAKKKKAAKRKRRPRPDVSQAALRIVEQTTGEVLSGRPKPGVNGKRRKTRQR